MSAYQLRVRLVSDATFARGDGVAGLVDVEVAHDDLTGLPIIPAKTVKGLLVEECANVLWSLERAGTIPNGLEDAARFLYGAPGSRQESAAGTRVGDATMPRDLAAAVREAVQAGKITRLEVLEGTTSIRRQSTRNVETGAPAVGSLRASRVVLRETVLLSPLDFDRPPSDTALALLGACALSVRHGGLGRNRGRGRLRLSLLIDGDDKAAGSFSDFRAILECCDSDGKSAT